MDPVRALGVSLYITELIGTTIHTLHTLKGIFEDADLTIRQFIGQLSTIKAALSQIQDWAAYNADSSPQVQEFMDGLETSLAGCREAIVVLSDHVDKLAAGAKNELKAVATSPRAVWDESLMQEHQARLSLQAQALQLVLTASQWYGIHPSPKKK
jgi:uncharacterized phage infection (PIP) family protein YhgE